MGIKALICDVDGTISDCRHRLHYVTGRGPKNWDAFFAELHKDTVITPVRDLLISLQRDHVIIMCSGRSEDYRVQTEQWFADNGVAWDVFHMRASGDHRPDHIVKSQILDGILADGYEPVLTIDDRPSVCALWRERGLVCLQMPYNDFPPNLGQLTLLVGPSGAGKDHYLANYPQDKRHAMGNVVSSDVLRASLCGGNFKDQSKNDEVFAALHAITATRIKHGLDTTVNATNLKRKDRLAVVNACPVGTPVTYIVIDRPLEEKLRDGGWRLTVPGLIERHDQTFRSQLKDILSGDSGVAMVIDMRSPYGWKAPI